MRGGIKALTGCVEVVVFGKQLLYSAASSSNVYLDLELQMPIQAPKLHIFSPVLYSPTFTLI